MTKRNAPGNRRVTRGAAFVCGGENANDGSHAEYHPALKDWLRAEPEDIVLALDVLRGDPFEFNMLLTRGRLERAPELACWIPETPEHQQLIEGNKQRVERYFAAVSVGACARCFVPVATFPDGRTLDWPALELHRDDCEATRSSPPRRPFESRP